MSNCITDDQFSSMLSGDFADSALSVVEQHLSACETCQTRLMNFVDEQEFADTAFRQRDTAALLEDSERLAAVKSNLLQSRILMTASSRRKPMEPVGTHAGTPASTQAGTPGLRNKLKPSDLEGSLGRFGSFDVLELLGSGGMGAVYQALSPEYAGPVAIKVLRPHAARDKQSRARFLREAEHLSVIDHPNVVRILDVHEIERTPCIVMEQVVGSSLQGMLDQGRLPLDADAVRQIALQTAAALAAAHGLGILHRDVKPANLMIEDSSGRVRLTDFGLAKAMHDVGLTASNAVPGTPEYMSPEQINGDDVDYRSDLFSLGSSLYFAATARSPFANQNILQVFRNVSSLDPDPVSTVTPEFDLRLSDVIKRLMSKEVVRRPVTAAALIDALT